MHTAIATPPPSAHQQALSQYLQRLQDDPTDGKAWIHAARVMIQMGAKKDAIEALRQGITLLPTDPDLLCELAVTLDQASVRKEPEALYRRALQAAPGHIGARVRLGMLRLSAADLDEAGQCFIEVLRRDPTHSAATAGAAQVLNRRGHIEDAWSLLTQSPARPSIPLAMAFATVARHGGDPSQALKIVKRQQRRAKGHDRAMLLFAEGDLYDRMGDPRRAWLAWTAANQSQGLSFNRDGHRRSIDTLIRVVRDLPASTGPTDDRPVFVVGMPRSGTTLTETLLDAHPRATGVGELENIRDLAVSVPRRCGSAKPTYLHHLAELPQLAPALGADYLAALDTLAPGAKRVIDKMPNNALHLGFIGAILPGARVIWCERNPDDIALSCFQKPMSAGLPWTTSVGAIRCWQQGLERLLEHYETTLAIPILRSRYEDLVTEPEAATRRLADFVGLDFDPAMLRFHEKRRQVATHSWDQVNQAVHTGRINRSAKYAEYMNAAP